MEILIVLLVFVLPVLSVILDDRKKKNIPKVKSKRIVWPDDKPVQPSREKMRPAPGAGDSVRPVKPASTAVPAPAAAPDPIRRADDTYDSAAGAGLTDSGARRPDAKAASAGHMYSARSTKSRSPEEEQRQPEEKKTFSEKQKLIIYSEILKPKFDS